MPLYVIIASINPVIALFLTVSFPPPRGSFREREEKLYSLSWPGSSSVRAVLSPAVSVAGKRTVSLLPRWQWQNGREWVCEWERTSQREWGTLLSAAPPTFSVFLAGEKKKWAWKKKKLLKRRVKYRSTLRAQKRNQPLQINWKEKQGGVKSNEWSDTPIERGRAHVPKPSGFREATPTHSLMKAHTSP